MRGVDDAREVEIHLRGEARYPPSYKGRETQGYGIPGFAARFRFIFCVACHADIIINMAVLRLFMHVQSCAL